MTISSKCGSVWEINDLRLAANHYLLINFPPGNQHGITAQRADYFWECTYSTQYCAVVLQGSVVCESCILTQHDLMDIIHSVLHHRRGWDYKWYNPHYRDQFYSCRILHLWNNENIVAQASWICYSILTDWYGFEVLSIMAFTYTKRNGGGYQNDALTAPFECCGFTLREVFVVLSTMALP